MPAYKRTILPDRGWCCPRRNASRRHRLIRFRITAFLVLRVTVNPILRGDGGLVVARKSFTDPAITEVPFAKTSAKAPRPRRIRSLESEDTKGRPPLSTIAYGQSLPASCSSSAQHFSAVFRGHPGPKPVCVLTLPFMGLIGPFHATLRFFGFSRSMYANPCRISSKTADIRVAPTFLFDPLIFCEQH